MVVQQGGKIVVVRDGKVLSKPFLDISSRVTEGGEQGLLGLAFAPDYAKTGLFYVYFTRRDGNQEVAEFKRSTSAVADFMCWPATASCSVIAAIRASDSFNLDRATSKADCLLSIS